MSTHNLKLLSLPCKSFKKKEIEVLSDTKAYVALNRGQQITHNKSKAKVISPECWSYEELSEQVDRLIRELEEIRTKGKEFFKREKKKRKEWLDKKSVE